MKLQHLLAASVLCGSIACTPASLFKPAPSDSKPSGAEGDGSAGSENQQPKEVEPPKELTLIEKAVSDEEFIHAAELKEDADQTAMLCQRLAGKPDTHPIKRTFCDPNNDPVLPTSLQMMQDRMGLRVPVINNRNQNGANGNPRFCRAGSVLRPSWGSLFLPSIRGSFIFNNVTPGQNFETRNFVAMGFVRGEQFAEIIVGQNDTDPNVFNVNEDPEFYLVSFKQACNAEPAGCSPGDLLTPAVESNWTSVTVYQDDDIKNTIVDCKHCHQPQGLETPKIGRMQELQDPWTHFMRDNRESNVLTADYYAAHGEAETYGGIPGPSIEFSDPANLEDMLRANDFEVLQVEAVEFPTEDVRDQVNAANNAQPGDNTTPGVSQAWEDMFQLSAQGRVNVSNDPNAPDMRNIIPVPYHDVKVTEPALLTKFTQQYQSFVNGAITADQMEDHRPIFRTDQKERADMGFAIPCRNLAGKRC